MGIIRTYGRRHLHRTTSLKAVAAVLLSFTGCTCLSARNQGSITGRHTDTAVTASAAATPPDSLDSATITAWKTASAPPVDSISGARLKAVQNVADAVRMFGGVQLKDYGGAGGLKTVNVRGMGSEHTAVFIDGIQIGNAQNAQVDLGRFSTEDLAAIILYSGQQDNPLQSAREYAAGAALHLVPVRPDFSDGRRYHGTARLRGGSFGTVSPYIRWEQKLGSKASISASIEYLGASGRYRFRCRKESMTAEGTPAGYDTTMVRTNSDIRALRAEADLSGAITGGEWAVKAYFYGSARGLPGAVVRRPELLSSASERQEDRNIFVQGRISRQAGRTYSFRISAKYANDRMRYWNDPTKDISAMPVDDSYLQQEAYLSFVQSLQLFQWWRLSIATDAQYCSLESDKMDFAWPRRAAFWGAAYTAFRFRKVSVTAGAVYSLTADFHNTGDSASGGRTRDFRNVVSPALTFRYSPFGSSLLAIGGSVKRSYRMPTFNDLYYSEFGNVSLLPEDAIQYSLRIDSEISPAAGWTLHAKTEAYYNNIKDKIVAVPTSNQFRWSMYNIGHTRTTGAEGMFGWEYSSSDRHPAAEAGRKTGWQCGMTVRYTFQRATDVSSPDSQTYGGQIPYIPRHSGSVSATVSWHGWRADYSFIFTGVRYTSSANLRSTMMPPWATHDISLSKAIPAGLTFRLTVNNILNRQYEIVPNYPMPRCNFFLAIGYSF